MLSSVNLSGGVQRRRTFEDQLNMRSLFKENDLISVSAVARGARAHAGAESRPRWPLLPVRSCASHYDVPVHVGASHGTR